MEGITLPDAKVSFDPFHVVALANTALDQVRRAEVKQVDELKHIRWGTLKDTKPRHRARLSRISPSRCKTGPSG